VLAGPADPSVHEVPRTDSPDIPNEGKSTVHSESTDDTGAPRTLDEKGSSSESDRAKGLTADPKATIKETPDQADQGTPSSPAQMPVGPSADKHASAKTRADQLLEELYQEIKDYKEAMGGSNVHQLLNKYRIDEVNSCMPAGYDEEYPDSRRIQNTFVDDLNSRHKMSGEATIAFIRNLSMCKARIVQLGERKIIYLAETIISCGKMYGPNGMTIDPKKLEAILKEWSVLPTTRSLMHSYLGLLVYWSEALGPYYQKLTAPLRPYLTKKPYKEIVTDEHALDCLERIKAYLGTCSLAPIDVSAVCEYRDLLFEVIDGSLEGPTAWVCGLKAEDATLNYDPRTAEGVKNLRERLVIHLIASKSWSASLRDRLTPLQIETYTLKFSKDYIDVQIAHLPRVLINDHRNLVDSKQQPVRPRNQTAVFNEVLSECQTYKSTAPFLNAEWVPGTQMGCADAGNRMNLMGMLRNNSLIEALEYDRELVTEIIFPKLRDIRIQEADKQLVRDSPEEPDRQKKKQEDLRESFMLAAEVDEPWLDSTEAEYVEPVYYTGPEEVLLENDEARRGTEESEFCAHMMGGHRVNTVEESGDEAGIAFDREGAALLGDELRRMDFAIADYSEDCYVYDTACRALTRRGRVLELKDTLDYQDNFRWELKFPGSEGMVTLNDREQIKEHLKALQVEVKLVELEKGPKNCRCHRDDHSLSSKLGIIAGVHCRVQRYDGITGRIYVTRSEYITGLAAGPIKPETLGYDFIVTIEAEPETYRRLRDLVIVYADDESYGRTLSWPIEFAIRYDPLSLLDYTPFLGEVDIDHIVRIQEAMRKNVDETLGLFLDVNSGDGAISSEEMGAQMGMNNGKAKLVGPEPPPGPQHWYPEDPVLSAEENREVAALAKKIIQEKRLKIGPDLINLTEQQWLHLHIYWGCRKQVEMERYVSFTPYVPPPKGAAIIRNKCKHCLGQARYQRPQSRSFPSWPDKRTWVEDSASIPAADRFPYFQQNHDIEPWDGRTKTGNVYLRFFRTGDGELDVRVRSMVTFPLQFELLRARKKVRPKTVKASDIDTNKWARKYGNLGIEFEPLPRHKPNSLGPLGTAQKIFKEFLNETANVYLRRNKGTLDLTLCELVAETQNRYNELAEHSIAPDQLLPGEGARDLVGAMTAGAISLATVFTLCSQKVQRALKANIYACYGLMGADHDLKSMVMFRLNSDEFTIGRVENFTDNLVFILAGNRPYMVAFEDVVYSKMPHQGSQFEADYALPVSRVLVCFEIHALWGAYDLSSEEKLGLNSLRVASQRVADENFCVRADFGVQKIIQSVDTGRYWSLTANSITGHLIMRPGRNTDGPPGLAFYGLPIREGQNTVGMAFEWVGVDKSIHKRVWIPCSDQDYVVPDDDDEDAIGQQHNGGLANLDQHGLGTGISMQNSSLAIFGLPNGLEQNNGNEFAQAIIERNRVVESMFEGCRRLSLKLGADLRVKGIGWVKNEVAVTTMEGGVHRTECLIQSDGWLAVPDVSLDQAFRCVQRILVHQTVDLQVREAVVDFRTTRQGGEEASLRYPVVLVAKESPREATVECIPEYAACQAASVKLTRAQYDEINAARAIDPRQVEDIIQESYYIGKEQKWRARCEHFDWNVAIAPATFETDETRWYQMDEVTGFPIFEAMFDSKCLIGPPIRDRRKPGEPLIYFQTIHAAVRDELSHVLSEQLGYTKMYVPLRLHQYGGWTGGDTDPNPAIYQFRYFVRDARTGLFALSPLRTVYCLKRWSSSVDLSLGAHEAWEDKFGVETQFRMRFEGWSTAPHVACITVGTRLEGIPSAGCAAAKINLGPDDSLIPAIVTQGAFPMGVVLPFRVGDVVWLWSVDSRYRVQYIGLTEFHFVILTVPPCREVQLQVSKIALRAHDPAQVHCECMRITAGHPLEKINLTSVARTRVSFETSKYKQHNTRETQTRDEVEADCNREEKKWYDTMKEAQNLPQEAWQRRLMKSIAAGVNVPALAIEALQGGYDVIDYLEAHERAIGYVAIEFDQDIHGEGREVPVMRDGVITEKLIDASKLPRKLPKFRSPTGLHLFKMKKLVRMDVFLTFMMVFTAVMCGALRWCSDALWAPRAGRPLGRFVVNLVLLNLAILYVVAPPMSTLKVQESLMIPNSPFGLSNDISRAFPRFALGKKLRTYFGINVGGDFYVAIRAMLGISAIPALWAGAIYPYFNGIKVSEIESREFIRKLMIASKADRSRGIPNIAHGLLTRQWQPEIQSNP
jgi:hypothetical protein